MTSLYKYLPAKYVERFIREGAILFRPLSYFRDYEDAQVRGDEHEGTRLHRPINGLETTLVETQQKIVLPHSFESTANEDDIFVFCASTILSAELATQFNADACIEVTNLGTFVGGIRSALLRRPSIKNKTLVHGQVKYYSPEEPPIVDWALPEKIAMSKLNTYTHQQEYRFTFAVNDAFRIENTSIRLVSPLERRPSRATPHPKDRLFKLGNISKLCKVHSFGEKF
jgi:hypothetical protein